MGTLMRKVEGRSNNNRQLQDMAHSQEMSVLREQLASETETKNDFIRKLQHQPNASGCQS